MLLADLLSESFFALWSNKSRSGLTILGIVIGIGSVIAMVSIGQGTQNQIEEQIQSLGSNLLTVSPVRSGFGVASDATLTQDDVDTVSGLALVQEVAPQISTSSQVTYNGQGGTIQIIGTTNAYSRVRNIEIDEGSFISDVNVQGYNKVAVIAPSAAETILGTNVDPIGEKIRIGSNIFTIIGTTKSEGTSGFTNQDNIIYVPLTTAQRYFLGSDDVSTISIQVVSEEAMTQAEQDVTLALLNDHGLSSIDDADFTVSNQADLVETVSDVTGTFTLLLASIAAISLLVGGIGIMNMMLTTVTERTKEIGLRKAIGAKSRDITVQFLTESIILTATGGVVGIIVGFIISQLISTVGGISVAVSLESVLLAFGVSAGIGILFGYYPAKQAAKLDPIKALRYE